MKNITFIFDSLMIAAFAAATMIGIHDFYLRVLATVYLVVITHVRAVRMYKAAHE